MLFLASSLCLILVLVLSIACRKTNKSDQFTNPNTEKLCKGKTEADILKMPAFLKENSANITKNSAGEVISISKVFDNKPNEMDGLELMVCFQKLETLMIFESGFQAFSKFPEYITEIKSLKELFWEVAKFKTLSENIGNLSNLEKVGFQMIEFKTLPDSFYTLKKLNFIGIRGSNLTETEKQKIRNTFPNAQDIELD